jgi:hypothetical protein
VGSGGMASVAKEGVRAASGERGGLSGARLARVKWHVRGRGGGLRGAKEGGAGVHG